LIEAAENEGTYIPRFCWHKRMQPVGMCRMCLVEVEGPRGKALTTACTTRVSDEMVVDTKSDTVKKAQEGVLEFLLINHPLDCPVCDRGGECPLQDQTMAYGPGESRFVEEKRHFEKPIPISELVNLDRERCILCARCTRFSEEISGDPLIEFVDRGYGTQVLTFPDEPFRSYFSGNTVEICPVGALTATPYRFRARPWDLEAVESTCGDCAVGCRVSVQASQNQVLRLNGIDNDPTNQGWLCDRGRFGFETIASPERLDTPLIRNSDGELEPASWDDAIGEVARRLAEFEPQQVAGLGGARGTNEEAFAFGKFLRAVIGTPHLDSQLDDGLDPHFLVGLTPRATIDDLETAKTILVWGPDLKEELPVLYLRVRRAAQELGATLIVVNPRRSGLDDVATHVVRYRPGQGPATLTQLVDGTGQLKAARQALGDGPVVALVGRTGITESPRLAEAVAAFARDLPEASIMPLARRGNVYGALDMGMAASLLPGRASARNEEARAALSQHWGDIPQVGRDAPGIVAGLADGTLQALITLGADPASDFPRRDLAVAALHTAEFVVALDRFPNESVQLADVVLPVTGFAETEGTVTNLEGRVQKVNRIVPGPGEARASWAVLEDVAQRLGGSVGESVEAIAKEIATVAPAYGGITWEGLDWGAGKQGLVVPGPEGEQPLAFIPVDPKLDAQSPDLALHLARSLYDDGVGVRFSTSLSKLTRSPSLSVHPDTAASLGLSDGDEVIATSPGGSAQLPVLVDSDLAPGTVSVTANLDSTFDLGPDLAVTLEKVGS
ncbi:MAG: NADH-quinone oxidoreductase subunit NuoG, partial [Acidimicrobiia bacterium]|nr:NADH-quinone oxidoreductase subunit NuoG [Acidimicrobiia bacterium]